MSGNSRGTFSRERPIGSTCDGVFNYLSLLIAVIRSRLLMARDLTSVSISPTSRSRCRAEMRANRPDGSIGVRSRQVSTQKLRVRPQLRL